MLCHVEGNGSRGPDGREYGVIMPVRVMAALYAKAPNNPGPFGCYLTLNFQVLFWLPAVLEFWSSELPAKSFALLVTVAT